MEALKCDRCGKFYTGNKKHRTSGKVFGSKIHGIATFDKYGVIDKKFDLCDDCITDLLESFKGKEINEEDERLLQEPQGTD